MKKLFLFLIVAGFISFGAIAQTAPGNSAYGHNHKKAKKHYHVTNTTAAHRRVINVQHKTAIRTIHDNDALTNDQQKNMIKEANTTHKVEMKSMNVNRKAGKK